MLSVLSSPSYMTGPQSLALSLVSVFPSQTTYCQPVLLPLCSDRIWLPLTSTTLWYKASTVWDAGQFHSLPLTSLLVYLLILQPCPDLEQLAHHTQSPLMAPILLWEEANLHSFPWPLGLISWDLLPCSLLPIPLVSLLFWNNSTPWVLDFCTLPSLLSRKLFSYTPHGLLSVPIWILA